MAPRRGENAMFSSILTRISHAVAVAFAFALLPALALAQSNPVVLENQNAGSDAWQILWGDAGDDIAHQIKGYASATSVNKGDPINLHISVKPAQNYSIDVYRLGWYQGHGARLMQHIGPLAGSPQATCPQNATTGLIECQWAVGYTLTTQASWTSGVYMALLTNAAGKQNYIDFVVRDDSRVAPLLYVQPVMTYQAYNDYPYNESTGKSLYSFNSYGPGTVGGLSAAVKVSFDRPYNGNGDADVWGSNILNVETAWIRWLERSGYDITYGTDIDVLSTNGAILRNYHGIVVPGHDEYWTKEMYDSYVTARDSGVNLAFFSANTAYTRVRMESSGTGVPNRVIVCYREPALDPVTEPAQKTVNLRDSPLNAPEQQLIGVQYTSIVQGDANGLLAPYKVINSGHWIYAGSGFHDGDTVKGLVGYEADRQFNGSALPPAVPGTYVLLANSPFTGSNSADTHNSSIYQVASGAWVFSAGTMNWGFALDDYNPQGQVLVNARIEKTTQNILAAFSGPVQSAFSLSAGPASQAVIPGGTASYTVTVGATGGFADPVDLSITGLPADTTASFSPNPATTTSTLTVSTSATTPASTSNLTISGASGAVTHTTGASLIVQIPEFGPSVTPSTRTVPQGGSTTFAVAVNPTGGMTGAVTFSVAGLPAGAIGTFSPNPTTGSTSLSVTTSLGTLSGTYPLVISGVSGALSHSIAATLTISQGTGKITVTAPNTAVSWKAATKQNITFTHNLGVGKVVNIDVSRDGGASWNSIAAFTTISATSGTYSWTVTGPVTAQGLIRVSANENATVFDSSDVNFSIVNPTITVTAPNTVTSWQAGSTKSITFSHTMGAGQPVNIELSRDNGATWSPIGSMTTTSTTSGTFSWVVTGPTTAAGLIRTTWGVDAAVTDVSNVNFIITPRTTVSAPNTAVSWAAGSLRTVTWSHNLGLGGLVDIDISTDNGASWSSLASAVPSSAATTGTLAVRMPATTSTQALVRVSPTGDTSIGDVSNVPFTLIAPTVTVTTPNTNVSWTVGTTQSIKWNHTLGKLESVKIEIARDGVNFSEIISGSFTPTSDTTGTFSWVVTGAVTTTAKIRVTWLNDANVTDASDVNFRIK
jgi:hypothetical protein